MNYPLTTKPLPNGRTILLPDPERIKPTYEQRLANNPNTAFPFWAKLWPSAIALAEFLLQHPNLLADKTTLEIGAGIGLPSFTVADLAASITISDHDPEAVDLSTQNINRLELTNTRALVLDWNHLPQDLYADTILLSDINYAPEQFDSLHLMFRRFLDAGSTLVLATPQRITSGAFMASLEPYMKASTVMTINEVGNTMDISISVLSL